jgi:hypothetical protein
MHISKVPLAALKISGVFIAAILVTSYRSDAIELRMNPNPGQTKRRKIFRPILRQVCITQ